MKHLILIIIFILSASNLFAQKEAYNWYMGSTKYRFVGFYEGSGFMMTFHDDGELRTFSLTHDENYNGVNGYCNPASISDKNGELIFYVHSDIIFSANGDTLNILSQDLGIDDNQDGTIMIIPNFLITKLSIPPPSSLPKS
jgi:hypothetical protein